MTVITLDTGYNLNALDRAGTYAVATPANAPVADSDWIVEVISSPVAGISCTIQRATNAATGAQYTRANLGGTWAAEWSAGGGGGGGSSAYWDDNVNEGVSVTLDSAQAAELDTDTYAYYYYFTSDGSAADNDVFLTSGAPGQRISLRWVARGNAGDSVVLYGTSLGQSIFLTDTTPVGSIPLEFEGNSIVLEFNQQLNGWIIQAPPTYVSMNRIPIEAIAATYVEIPTDFSYITREISSDIAVGQFIIGFGGTGQRMEVLGGTITGGVARIYSDNGGRPLVDASDVAIIHVELASGSIAYFEYRIADDVWVLKDAYNAVITTA